MTATAHHLPFLRHQQRVARSQHRPPARRLAATALVLAALAAYAALLVGTRAFAEPAGQAGFGSDPGLDAGSGYTAAHLNYVADPADPSRVVAVGFDVTPAGARTVRVRFAPDGAWYACTTVAAAPAGARSAAVTCPTTTAGGAPLAFAAVGEPRVSAR